MTDVGLTILEGVAQGASSVKEPAKRNIGLLGQFTRGLGFSPTKVTSLEDFNIIFGGPNSSFYGPAIVKSIFDEAGSAPVVLYIARVVGDDAVTASKSVTTEGTKTMVVTAGYKGSDDPGAWGNDIKAILYSYGYKAKDAFKLSVLYKGVVKENYVYGTLAEIQASVNQVSKYVTVEFSAEMAKLTTTSLTGTATCSTNSAVVTGVGTSFIANAPVGTVLYDSSATPKLIGTVAAVTSDTSLTLTSKAFVAVTGAAIKTRTDLAIEATLLLGADGTISESNFYPTEVAGVRKGLACFNGQDVQIIATTEYHSLTMAKKLRDYLNTLQSPIGLINLPMDADLGVAELYALELQSSEVNYVTPCLGFAKVLDANGNTMVIPSLGIRLGAAFLRTPYLAGDYIHIPPAGVDSLSKTAIDMIPSRLTQPEVNRYVQDFSCNVFQFLEGSGFYVSTSRTYSTNPLYQSVHIRQQTSFYKRLLGIKMLYVAQKPNTPELKREALLDLRTFFKTEYNNGALERSVPFETAYQGICDKSNNPDSQDRKLLNIDVLWIPTECVESSKITLQRNDGILITKE